jgi:hypothetical protein
LASGRRKEVENRNGGEAGELARDVLSVLAHELGGIASALDLRAHVIAASIPSQDLTAFRELAEELRLATRAIRLVRGPDGSGTLNPAKKQPISEWWKLTSRFLSVVLPRGVAVETQISGGELNATQASTLTWLLLTACKELAERTILMPATIVVRGASIGNGEDGIELSVEIGADRLSSSSLRQSSRWKRYASKVARERGVTAPRWERDAALLRWQCTVK